MVCLKQIEYDREFPTSPPQHSTCNYARRSLRGGRRSSTTYVCETSCSISRLRLTYVRQANTDCPTSKKPTELILRHLLLSLNVSTAAVMKLQKQDALDKAAAFEKYKVDAAAKSLDSKAYLRASRLIANWIAARVTKAVRLWARFS